MTEETTLTPKEERDRAKRNRGLRAAAPTAAPPAKPPAQPSGEVASILDQMQADNAAAGLTKAQPPSADQAPAVEVVREEIKHDYEQNGPGTFTTLKGVVLRIKPFPHDTAVKIQANMLPDRPRPPREYVEADEKWVENANDPEYQEALGAYISKAAEIAFYVRVGMGTELHKEFPIPADVWALESDDWIDFIGNEDLFGKYGIKANREGIRRYIDWLDYYVFGEGDIRHLYEALDFASGLVRERVVVKEMDSFRRSD